MAVLEDAATRPAIWRTSASPAVRQDARRRAAVAAVDALAAVATATVLSYWLHAIEVRTAALVPASWTIAAWLMGAYRHRRLKVGIVDAAALVRTVALLCSVAGVVGALSPHIPARELVLCAIPTTALTALCGRLALLPLSKTTLAPAPVALVGPAESVWDFLVASRSPGAASCHVAAVCLTDRPDPRDSALTAELAASGLDRAFTLADLPAIVRRTGADTVVVVGGLERDELRTLAWEMEQLAVGVAVTPVWTVAPQRVGVRMLGGTTGIEVAPPQYEGGRLLVREVADRVLALVALVCLSPVLVLIAALVKVTSPRGPVLFRQDRTGFGGQRFKLLKFRTMVPNAEALKASLANEYSEGTLFKNKKDPRITPLGAWLRKFSLDELPQLINVVRGDMLLVGPRPTSTPYEKMPADYSRRTLVKPGLTGLWQVSGRSDLPWEDAVRLDLHYVENRSLELDLDILFRRTLPAVLGRKGAY